MKKNNFFVQIMLIFCFVLISSAIFGTINKSMGTDSIMKPTSECLTLKKNEIDVNISSFISLLLNDNKEKAIKLIPEIMYKRNIGGHYSLRAAFKYFANPYDMRFDLSINHQTSPTKWEYTNVRKVNIKNYNLKVGLEHYTPISFANNKCNWFYGADLNLTFTTGDLKKYQQTRYQTADSVHYKSIYIRNQDTSTISGAYAISKELLPVESTEKTKGIDNFGITPFTGITFPINNTISLTAQTSFDILCMLPTNKYTLYAVKITRFHALFLSLNIHF